MDQIQCFKNLQAVLEEAGSSLDNVVKVGVFLTSMDNFAAMNSVSIFSSYGLTVHLLP